MAAPPILLVADDLSTIAAVKRVLAREGYEVVLATSAADAVIGFGYHLPGLVLVQPSVEGERGAVLLEELQAHPETQLLKVILLGETLPGFGYPVEPLPLDPAHFAQMVADNIRGTEGSTGWAVLEPQAPVTPPPPVAGPSEFEPWRATRPVEPGPSPSPTPPSLDLEMNEAVALAEPELPGSVAPVIAPAEEPPSAAVLQEQLFGDLPALEEALHNDVEAEVMRSVESTLQQQQDHELEALEADVRAEAARRRQARAEVPEDVEPAERPTPPPSSLGSDDEMSFAGVDEHRTPPPEAPQSRARDALSRAEAMVLEGRAVSDAQRRAAEADERRRETELAATTRRAEQAEALAEHERASRAHAEDEVLRLREALEEARQALTTEREEAQRRFEEDLETMRSQAETRRGKREQELQKQLEQVRQEAELNRIELEGAVLERDQKLGDVSIALEARHADHVDLARQLGELRTALAAETDTARVRAEELATLELAQAQSARALEAARADIGAAEELASQQADLVEAERAHRARLEQQLEALQGEVGRIPVLEETASEAAEARDASAREVRLLQATLTEQARQHQETLAELERRLEAGADARHAALATEHGEQVRALEARHAQTLGSQAAEHEAAHRALEAAHADALRALVTEHQATLARAQAERQALEAAHADALRAQVTQHEATLARAQAEREALEASHADALRAQAAEHEATLARTQAERQALEAAHAQALAMAQRSHTEVLTAQEGAHADTQARLVAAEAHAIAQAEALTRAEGERARLLDEAQQEHQRLTAQVEALTGQLSRLGEVESLEREAETARRQADQAVKDLRDAATQVEQLAADRDALEAARAEAADAARALAAERDALRAQVEGLTHRASSGEQALEQARAAVGEISAQLAQTRATLEEERSRAEAQEAMAQLADEKVKQLEHRSVMSLALPGRRALGVARFGEVDLEGLSRLVAQLVVAEADVRLELGAPGGTRTVWFRRGAIAGAESTLEHETLIDRARRDGLLDAKQEADLRMLRAARPREQLDAMVSRGFVRDIEAVPLAQRLAEFVALEAFTEPLTQYRLADDAPGPGSLLAAVPRPTLPLLAEALRRALPPDELLETLGGGEARPFVLEGAALDLRALGFSTQERKMLSWVDGEASVEDLTLASGLKPENAWRALLVARWLGAVELKPAPEGRVAPAPGLDVQRLEAKYDEVQEADYFTILGLPRNAGSDDVQRAFERLSMEFDPLKFSGHPDATLQQRAQAVQSLLEEAARALEDDRRRVEYARHLMD
jgi:hypothetical protein